MPTEAQPLILKSLRTQNKEGKKNGLWRGSRTGGRMGTPLLQIKEQFSNYEAALHVPRDSNLEEIILRKGLGKLKEEMRNDT